MNSKKFGSDKYFIYTIQEYFKNEYMKVENRKFQSIREQLLEFLEITELINSGESNTVRLNNSRKALVESIIFYFEYSLIIKNKELKRDIELLRGNLKKYLTGEINVKQVELSISSFYKKLNKMNIIILLLNIQIEKIENFEECDINLECLISELLYEGYTLEYLNSWYGREELNNKVQKAKEVADTTEILKCFKQLADITKNKFDIILNLMLPQNIREELIKEKMLEIANIKYSLIDEEKIVVGMKDIKIANGTFFVEASINSCDSSSAIKLATKSIERYMSLYTIFETNIGSVVRKCFLKTSEGIKEVNLAALPKYTHKLNYREKEDIQDFINLRDEFRRNKNTQQALREIERVINVVQKNPNDTLENTLLNLWGALENILINYDAGSIIDKVYQIIPKVIVMYSMKREMNHLWDKIYPLVIKEKINVEGLSECRVTGSNKYNKREVAEFLLKEKTGIALFKATSMNIGTSRQVASLNKLLKDPKCLLERLKFEESSIKHNISAIYRIRNNISHTGKAEDKNLESSIVILKYYINCIIGTLVHHIRRNPDLTVKEILNSIILTYDEYIENIKGLVDQISNIKEEKKERSSKIEEAIIDYGVEKIAFMKYLYI